LFWEFILWAGLALAIGGFAAFVVEARRGFCV
jgi:hypothetical protein